MKQISQNYKTGSIRIEDVTVPALKPGGILVKTHFSVVSGGTEGMKVREGKLSYLGKARARPDQVKKVFGTLRQHGLVATYQKVMNKLDTLTPLGYSLSGEVIATGRDVNEFHVGQLVACAGAGYANHAEVNFIPRNLAVPVPAGVAAKHAAFATIGAIALQSFRQAQMQLGETACVIGLGLLGQLLVQILRAAGVQVVGADLVEERCQLAERLGAKVAVTPEGNRLVSAVERLTNGYGADCVFIAAGGSSNVPVELAVEIARDRARVVDIGKTRLDLPWNDYYMKELDVRFSRSYGPGRYDPSYEEAGVDYPIGYVRWTERRNLAAFLDLVAEGKVKLDPIVTEVRQFSDAEQVYQEMADNPGGVLGTVFDYRGGEVTPNMNWVGAAEKRMPRIAKGDYVRLGVIGAGNYASSMLLPHLLKNGDVRLASVATTTSLTAQNAKRKFGFGFATTDYRNLVDSEDIDAVIIATRHASHAGLVAEALKAGKAVFVEKPLALSVDDLDLVHQAITESGNDRLMVGFNRRFSPMVRSIAEQLEGIDAPLVGYYRVHAGQLDQSSWYLDRTEGSRFCGEAGHFFDVLSYLIGSRPTTISATGLRPLRSLPDDRENIVATIQYQNGSVGSLLYLTQGGAKLPKEYLEMFGGGQTARLDNFETLMFFAGNDKRKVKALGLDKGQKNELKAFVDAVRTGVAMPVPAQSLFDTTLTTLAAEASLLSGAPIELATFWQPGTK